MEWKERRVDNERASAISKGLGIHPGIAGILVARGMEDLEGASAFLYGSLEDLQDPFLFPHMDQVVRRILKARDTKERICIYGDADVDGMTSTVLLLSYLESIDITVYPLIISNETSKHNIFDSSFVSFCRKRNITLVITVDCGMTAMKTVHEVGELGIDVIVTDHHSVAQNQKTLCLTINPKTSPQYPDQELTGVGVAYKVTQALHKKIGEKPLQEQHPDLLPLVALGTVADMGIMQGENRILTKLGLSQIRSGTHIGISALCEEANIDQSRCTSGDIATRLAPLLNSVCRIDDPHKGVTLLRTKTPFMARALAEELKLNNTRRQMLERSMSQQVQSTLKQSPSLLKKKAIILSSKEWHPGIISILCAKMVRTYQKPIILIAVDKEGCGKGSLRTTPNLSLMPILDQLHSFLVHYGGHNAAAGLSIEEDQIPPFSDAFNEAVRASLESQSNSHCLIFEGTLNYKDLSSGFVQTLSLLEPYGNGNPPPLFYMTGQALLVQAVGKEKQNLKFRIRNQLRTFTCMAFNKGERLQECLRGIPGPIHILFCIHTEHHNQIRIEVKDFSFTPPKQEPGSQKNAHYTS